MPLPTHVMQVLKPSNEVYRPYRAPRESGSALIDPPLSAAGRLLAENIERPWTQETWWSRLRQTARHQLLRDSLRYTSAYRNVDWLSRLGWTGSFETISDACFTQATTQAPPIVMAGHQPELFHAGVWFKNFALSQLGESLRAIPINLVVDNDVAMRRGIRVPVVDPDTGDVASQVVSFDTGSAGVPYEQLHIEDLGQFDHFDAEVQRLMRPLVSDPIVRPLWKHARAAIDRCGVAGCALAQARHAFEGELGLETLEIPLSVVARSTAFAKFVLAILNELPRFHRCYNESAGAYRLAHGIRSTAHPVPNLAQVDDWFEAPLWMYGDQSPARRSVWVRSTPAGLMLSDRQGRELVIADPESDSGAEQFASLQGPQLKIRPRALLTTMYARLVLSDLFLHGIGGGKYDQLGDRISESFFEVTAPHFMVLSATIRLPNSQGFAVTTRTVDQLKQDLRATRFHPELFARWVSLDESLVARKRALLERIPERGEKLDWHRELRDINERLSASLSGHRTELRKQLVEARRQQAVNELLASREHPFCLFPTDYLVGQYRELLAKA